MPAATKGTTGQGTTLGYSSATGTPSTYTDLALVVSVSPNVEVGEVENVILSSTFKAYLPTLGEGDADFTIQVAQGDGGNAFLQGLLASKAIVHWSVKTPDNSACKFDGFLKSYNPTFENEEITEADCSIRMTTQPEFAAGT